MERASRRRGRRRGRSGEGEVVKFALAVQASQALGPRLRPGLQAVKEGGILVDSAQYSYSGCVDIDAAYQASEPNANRWDYTIGLARNENEDGVVWIEVHPASSSGNAGEIQKKRTWLILTMRRDARALVAVNSHLLLWLVTGGVSPHAVRGIRAIEELGVKVKAAGKVTVDEMMNWQSHRFPKR